MASPVPHMSLIRLSTGLVDLDRGIVVRDGGVVSLTDKEVALLRYLAAQADPVSQETLLHEVWQYSTSVISRTVRVTVGRLRKKIERDPAQPEHLVTVYGEGYRLVRTDLAPAAPPRGVPAEVDRFVGRAGLLDTLERELAAGRRLITLVGPPGIGKTRLAQHLASTRAGGRTAWLCELAGAASVSDVTHTVAATLGLDLARDDAIEQVGRALRGRGPTLLVLDNLEQVAHHAPDTVGRWLRIASATQVLATSREPLRLRGEHLVAVPPLESDEAIDLLVDRAASLGAQLDPVAALRLVEAVDRLPLAIELVASQLVGRDADAVREELDQRLTELRTSLRDVEPRHLSLRAALDSSWSRLQPDARLALARATVFRGGFGREAAAEVLGDVGWLDHLVERSLVRRLPGERYDLFVAVRQFAAARLPPDDAARARHARHFSALGDEGRLAATMVDAVALAAVRAEMGNLTAALERGPSVPLVLALAVAQEGQMPTTTTTAWTRVVLAQPLDPADRVRVLIAHGNALRLASAFEEADAALVEAERAAVGPGWRGRARLIRGLIAAERAEPAAVDLLSSAVQDLRVAGDTVRVGRALGPLGIAHLRRRELDAALVCLEEGLSATAAAGDRSGVCSTLANLCTTLRQAGRIEEACARGDEAVAMLDALDSRRKQGLTLLAVGMAFQVRGDGSRARELIERAVQVFRTLGTVQYEGVTMAHLANVDAGDGDLERARTRMHSALSLLREAGDRNQEAVTLGNLGNCNLDLGRLDEARSALQAAIEIHGERGNLRAEGHFLAVLAEVESRDGNGALAGDLLDRAEGLVRQSGDLVDLATLLVRRAQIQPERAPRLVLEARELVDQAGLHPGSSLIERLEAIEARSRVG